MLSSTYEKFGAEKGGFQMSGTIEYQKMNENLLMADGHAMKAPEDYQNPEELYQVLVDRVRKYHPSADISMLEKAYQTAREAHKDQVRKSGEPYIIHPLWVGIILADLEMDKETIAAGMLARCGGRYGDDAWKMCPGSSGKRWRFW